MKKSTLFLAVALLVTIGFSSCENQNSLAGTTWLSEIIDIKGNEFQMEIEFYNEPDCKIIPLKDHYYVTGEYKYTCKSSKVSIIFDSGTPWTGTINGNEMTLSMFDKDVIFIKQ